MKNKKVMALLLSSLIFTNQLTSIVSATTLENNDTEDKNISTITETINSHNESSELPESTEIGNVSNDLNKTENSSDDLHYDGLPSDDLIEDLIPSTEEDSSINESDLVPLEAWENNYYLINEVLGKSGVTEIDKVTYDDLKKVKTIDLSFTYNSIPKILTKFTELVSLDVSGNSLSNSDEFFEIICELTNLKELDISVNNFTTIPDSFSNLKNLEYLYASVNNFSKVPNVFLDLPNLNYIELEYCNISELPVNIDKLSSLISLDLAYNTLSELPTSIGNMSSLRYLGLASNEFSTFPKEILNIEKLEDLDLSNNSLITIPKDIINFNGDKLSFTLNINNNQVYSLPELTTQQIICYNNFIEQSYSGFPWNAQLRLENNDLILDINEKIDSERFKEFVYVYKFIDPYNGLAQSLDERLQLDLIIDGNIVTPEDLSNYDEGIYTGKLKIHGSDANNLASETSETFKILIGNVSYEDEDKDDIVIPEDATGVIPMEYWENCVPLMAATYSALDGKDISEITFEDLLTIEELPLISQSLNNLPTLVTKYANLKNLYMDFNNFRKIPKEVFKLKNLEVLSLSYNGILDISSEISTLTNLKFLNLSGNVNIQDSLDNLFEVKSLVELYLSECNLYSISDKINNLTNLETLYVYNNQLASINTTATSLIDSDNLIYKEDDIYKQLILNNNTTTLTKENLLDQKYLNSVVNVKYYHPDLEDYFTEDLNSGHTLEFIIDSNVVSAEDLSKYPDGTYEATIKVVGSDINNIAAITDTTIKINIEGNNTLINKPTKPSTGTSNGSKPNKLPQTGNEGFLALLLAALISITTGAALTSKKKSINTKI